VASGRDGIRRSARGILRVFLAACLVVVACGQMPASMASTAGEVGETGEAAPCQQDPGPESLREAQAQFQHEPVKIALIDTGVRLDRLPKGARVEAGRNYVFEGGDTTDRVGHGTRIAGIILGIAPDVTLVPLVYYSRYPSGVPTNGGIAAICRAIYDAIDVYGCRVVNLSSGVGVDDPNLRDAVRYAEEKGVIVVSAVGNDRAKDADRVFYPAAYDTVVGVGAVGAALEAAPFSQVNGSVLVVAPGTDLEVPSIREGSTTEKVSGTSYAAAYVAACAALLVSAHPDITPEDFREVLKVAAQDLGEAGYDQAFGWGLIDPRTRSCLDACERVLRTRALPFRDVSASDWFFDAVVTAYETGLMLGESATSFGPGRPATWEMAATALYRLHARFVLAPGKSAGASVPSRSSAAVGFGVSSGVGFGVHSCADSGIDSGVSPDWLDRAVQSGAFDEGFGRFFATLDPKRAGDPITREELCVALVKYCGYAGVQLPECASDGAPDYMAIAQAAGLIRGDAAELRPADTASRAELATLLARLFGLLLRR